MSNSALVDYVALSPNNYGERICPISRISPHCTVGQITVETIGNIFASTARQASCNYGIGTDGRVALVVDENKASWCTSSYDNDQKAVTIECASDSYDPYAFNDAVYNKLVKLCVDICKRNGKKKLIWIADKDTSLAYNPKSDEMLLTVHRWFKNKACPGDWMMARMDDLANKVTKELNPVFVSPEKIKNAVYRLYNPNNGDHFFTYSATERDNLIKSGWTYESVGWKAPKKTKVPVYRVYNPNNGQHFFTTSIAEKNSLVKNGWKHEGIAFYSDEKLTTPIYRLYNPNSGQHFFTTSKSEKKTLMKNGWKSESVDFYGI